MGHDLITSVFTFTSPQQKKMKYQFALLAAAAAFAQAQESISASADISIVPGETLSMDSTMMPEPSAAQSATPSGLPVTENTTYAYQCEEGNSLTYAIVNATFSGVDLMTAVDYFSMWTMAAPGEVTDSSGSNMTDDTRTYTPEGADYEVSQTLTNATIDEMTGALHQTFETTDSYELSDDLTVSAAYYDLQVYEDAETGETTMQYFVNACTNNQEALLEELPFAFQRTITYWEMQLNGAAASGMMSGSMSMSMEPTSSAGALSSAADALSSATGAPAAGLSSATAGIASAIPTALPSLRARAAGRWD